jgi:hypothetical protein
MVKIFLLLSLMTIAPYCIPALVMVMLLQLRAQIGTSSAAAVRTS